MATAVVSGRVDVGTKKLADAYIRESGATTGEVISAVWSKIAETGEVPMQTHDKTIADKRAIAVSRLREIRSSAPLGTPLSTMTDEQITEELSKRD